MNLTASPTVSPAKSTLLASLAAKYAVEPGKLLETMKATVFDVQASNAEMIAFLTVAHRYDLDPFRGEIYAFRRKEKGIQPIVGLDGWAAIVNRRPEFDGVEYEDVFDDVQGPGRSLLAIRCKIFRKDRGHAITTTEYMHECVRNTGPWQQWPARMLRHKAFIQCARIAFGLSGIVDEDEADRLRYVEAADATPPVAATDGPPKTIDELVAKEKAKDAEKPKAAAKKEESVESLLLKEDASSVLNGASMVLGNAAAEAILHQHGGNLEMVGLGLGRDAAKGFIADLRAAVVEHAKKKA